MLSILQCRSHTKSSRAWTTYIYFYLQLFLNILLLINIPIKKPKLLWIISSNSNKPLHKTNCNNSIEKEIPIPINNPIFQSIFLPYANGKKIPIGKSITIFNIFSNNKSYLEAVPNLPIGWIISFQDQNISNWYFLVLGNLENTVDP